MSEVYAKFSLFFHPLGTGPNAGRTPYMRSALALLCPLYEDNTVKLNNFYRYDSTNETYISFTVPVTATNLVQSHWDVLSSCPSSGTMSGAMKVVLDDGGYFFFPKRGNCYSINVNPVILKVELIGDLARYEAPL